MRTVLAMGMMAMMAALPAFADSPFETHEYRAPRGHFQAEPLRYRLLTPGKIEAGRKYPLVVFLHGAGERGGDNAAQLKFLPTRMASPAMREKYPCFLVAPQCPANRRWASIDWRGGKVTYNAQPTEELDAVYQVVLQIMKERPIDRDRVYLTGLSMGGYGTWELATRHRELFAAAAPICGGGDKTDVKPLVGLPLWAWHGDHDKAVNVERSREMIAAVKAAGGEPRYTEIPGGDHAAAWTQAYTRHDGVIPWLFEQRKK